MKRIFSYSLLLILTFVGYSVSAQQVEMADKMRADGKIYVVVAIIVTILLGFILYLVMQDRKLNRLEKYFDNKGQTK